MSMSGGAAAGSMDFDQRATEASFYAYTAPVRPVKAIHACPHCGESHVRPSHTFQRLRSGITQLAMAVVMILFSILRLARLMVAMAFALVALIGSAFFTASRMVVHPDDRRLLPRVPWTRS